MMDPSKNPEAMEMMNGLVGGEEGGGLEEEPKKSRRRRSSKPKKEDITGLGVAGNPEKYKEAREKREAISMRLKRRSVHPPLADLLIM